MFKSLLQCSGLLLCLILLSLNSHTLLAQAAEPPTESTPEIQAKAILKAAIDNWRGMSSYSEMTMRIHRPDWERSVSMRGWTRGDKDSLVRVTAPKKDIGTGTLTLDKGMWTFSPKVNRVIKVPSSMMNQSWMGSDFSNKDISKADEIVHSYSHKLTAIHEQDGHKVYEIEAIPHEDAAVVWGKQVIRVRDDHVMLSEAFYDQDGILVKRMDTLEIQELDGRPVATRQRMLDIEEEDHWTEIILHTVDFNIELADSVFTLSNLRNPRD